MKILPSVEKKGWIGFFIEEGNGNLEEFYSIKDLDFAQKILNSLNEDLLKLKIEKYLNNGRLNKL